MNSLITNVQFPFRFLSVATLCLALLTGLTIKGISEYDKEMNSIVVLNAKTIMAIFSIVIVTLSVISASYYMTEKGTSDEFTYIVDEFEEGGIMGAEYLPSGTAEDYNANYNEPYSETAVRVEFYSITAEAIKNSTFTISTTGIFPARNRLCRVLTK